MGIELIDATKRAECYECNEKIEEGKQVRANLGTGNYPHNFHLKCFKDKYWRFIHALFDSLTDAERQDLEQ